MLADYHVHTPLCKHAEGLPSEYVAQAIRKGLGEICFTDHVPAPSGYDAENRMRLAQFPEYRAMVRAAAPDGILVRFGIEADYAPAELKFLRRWLPEQDFDLVLGSVHFIGDWGFDNPLNLSVWNRVDVTQVWRDYFKLVMELADSRLFDALAHPDLPKKFGHRPPEALLREIVPPALDRLAAADMAIEVSTAGLRKPVNEIYPSSLILRLAREREIPVTLGSDAHSPEEVGFAFDRATALARECGYTEFATYCKRQRSPAPLA